MRPVLSPDGKWLVYATRYKTDTSLRIRNLETGAERWLVSPVTRDDQESRASRDTLPRYDFLPDGRSIVVPIAGRLQRIDVETGRRHADSVHRARADGGGAARLLRDPHRRRAAGAGAARALAAGVAGWAPSGLQRAQPSVPDGSAGWYAAPADPRPPKVSSCPPGRPMASRSPTPRGPPPAVTSSGCRRPAAHRRR
jgi:hypothetical protein